MNGTPLAGRLVLAISALVKPAMCIFQQFLTVWAQRTVAFVFAAIHANHLSHHGFFLLYAMLH